MEDKKKMIEDALGRIDPKLIAESMNAPKEKEKSGVLRFLPLAAAVLLLTGAGLFFGNRLSVNVPVSTEPQENTSEETTEENGQLNANTNPDRYAIALAAYPVLPEKPNFQNAVYEKELTNYLDALSAIRAKDVTDRYVNQLAAYTKKAANVLLKEGTEQNFVFSPANLYLALGMLAETTENETREEILRLLGTEDISESGSLCNAVWRNLFQDGPGNEKTLLCNALWLNKDFSFRKKTLDLLSELCFADSFSVPMGEAKTDAAIGQWINEHTGKLLTDFAEAFRTEPDTAAVLLSTLYFKDRWKREFNKQETDKGLFSEADGEEKTVEMMHALFADQLYLHHTNKHYAMAELSFTDEVSMVFLLPDEGTSLKELLEEGEVTEGFLEWKDSPERVGKVISWSIPRFDIQSDLSLKDALGKLGISKVFDEESADFSPLSEANGLYLKKAQHAARVTVDEEGCEAAAVTAFSVLAGNTLPVAAEKAEMNLNRPFAFMITGVDGLPLFIGVVNEV